MNTTCMVSYQGRKHQEIRNVNYHPSHYDQKFQNQTSYSMKQAHDSMSPDEHFAGPLKKPKLLPEVKTTKNILSDKTVVLEEQGRQINNSKEKPFKCTICGHSCNRKDNFNNHMRIHSQAKPYICPYVIHQKDQNVWEPCLYAAARQDDLTKHCNGTIACHLEKFDSTDYENYAANSFPVPVKVIGGKKNFKLRKDNVKLSEPLYREYLNQSPAFMYDIELKIMRKWTAVWNASVKKKDEQTKRMLKNKRIPSLMQGRTYDRIGQRVFKKPQIEFCDLVLNLDELDFRGLFENYVLGEKVEQTHINPKIHVWSDEQTLLWKRRVIQLHDTFTVKIILENH